MITVKTVLNTVKGQYKSVIINGIVQVGYTQRTYDKVVKEWKIDNIGNLRILTN